MGTEQTKPQGRNSTAWVQENRPILYTVHMIPQLRRKYHVGQRITVISEGADLYGRNVKRRKSCRVVGVYPNIVAMVDRSEIVECFSYLELEMGGITPSQIRR